MWNEVAATIQLAEAGLGLSYEPATTPKPAGAPGKENAGMSPEKRKDRSKDQDEFISYEDPFEAAMAVHTLMMSVVYFTHVGDAPSASPRLSHLHALLDSGALETFSDGTVEVRVTSSCWALDRAADSYSPGQIAGWSATVDTSDTSAHPLPLDFSCQQCC